MSGGEKNSIFKDFFFLKGSLCNPSGGPAAESRAVVTKRCLVFVGGAGGTDFGPVCDPPARCAAAPCGDEAENRRLLCCPPWAVGTACSSAGFHEGCLKTDNQKERFLFENTGCCIIIRFQLDHWKCMINSEIIAVLEWKTWCLENAAVMQNQLQSAVSNATDRSSSPAHPPGYKKDSYSYPGFIYYEIFPILCKIMGVLVLVGINSWLVRSAPPMNSAHAGTHRAFNVWMIKLESGQTGCQVSGDAFPHPGRESNVLMASPGARVVINLLWEIPADQNASHAAAAARQSLPCIASAPGLSPSPPLSWYETSNGIWLLPQKSHELRLNAFCICSAGWSGDARMPRQQFFNWIVKTPLFFFPVWCIVASLMGKSGAGSCQWIDLES